MTILFKSDWNRYPGSIVHTTTKNKHFLKLSATYRAMGIENHAFMLALLQPELEHVDPHDVDNLDLETMGKILYECKHNFWYFIREVIKAPPLAGIVPEPFKANRANIAAYWLFFCHVMFVLIQPRQTGKSFSIDVLMIYLFNIGSTSTLINMLTRSDDLRTQNLIRLKKIQEELPYYLDFRSKGDIFNTEEIKIAALENMYKGNVSNQSPKLANNVGRGFTSPVLHVDEACFVPNIEIALSAALMAGNAARDSARRNNMPYGTILTTTTGKVDDRDAKYIYQICNAATVWDDKFLDAENEEELINLIMTNSRASENQTKRPVINLTMSYRQLGYDDNWMRQKLEETLAEGEDADRDLFNRWTSGSARSPIADYAEKIRSGVMDNYRTDIYKPYNYVLRWYITEDEVEYRSSTGTSFIIGVDTSDAVGRDDIAFVMRDHKTGEVICTAVFNEINLITLADFFVDFLLRYLNAVMIIERRSSAAAIIDYMIQKLSLHDINPFKRLFSMIVQESEVRQAEYALLLQAKSYNQDFFIKNKKYIGFTTSGVGVTSRSELYSSTLISMCKYTGNLLYDKQVVDQVLALVIRNNRVDHPEGGNDDMVIASLLSYWLLIKGKNLSYYGIDTSTILSKNSNFLEEKYSDSALDNDEIYEKEQHITVLIEDYKNERNPILAKQIELKLQYLSNELNNKYNRAISIEQMLDDIRKEKRLKQRY